MILLSHPTGNANVRGALRAFQGDECLAGFFTALGFTQERLHKFPPLLKRKLARRAYDVSDSALHTRPLREAIRLLSGGRCMSVDAVYHDLDMHLARQIGKGVTPEVKAIYAYEDGAAASFEAAHQAGLRCIYEQPIGYWRAAHRILKEEAERQPAWAATLDALRDSPDKLKRKDRELRLAQHVITASSFTRQTLLDYPGRLPPVSVIPYGSPASLISPQKRAAGKLRVLYVGGLSQRKGLSYLFEAVDTMYGGLELTVMGRGTGVDCPALTKALSRHRYIETLPNPDVIALMRASDVLVFPSLFEGFGLVLTEALSQGIPIIATSHTAAPDLITDGREGFIVPIRSATAIREKLEMLLSDPERLAAMKQAAWERSQELTWDLYSQRLLSAVHRAINGID